MAQRGAPGAIGVENVTDAPYQEMMGTHLKNALFGVQLALPATRKQGDGFGLLTSSIAAISSRSSSATYAMAKAAIIHLTKWLAFNYGRENIRVNRICPYAHCYADLRKRQDREEG